MTGQVACLNCGNDQMLHGYGRHKKAGAITVISCQVCQWNCQANVPSVQAVALRETLRATGCEIVEMAA